MPSARIRLRFLLVLTVSVLSGLTQACSRTPRPAKPQPPATILLIRHAEKLTDDQIDLSPTGFERANLLPKLFSDTSRTDLPRPQVLFASHISEHSDRPMQTLAPLAEALHLPVDDRFTNEEYPKLAADLLSGKYAGKVVLVVWHHGRIPQLATALGATPPYNPWPDTQYDRIWRIDYVNGKATLQDLPYAIMPGDSK
jgi:hypothetical protein